MIRIGFRKVRRRFPARKGLSIPLVVAAACLGAALLALAWANRRAGTEYAPCLFRLVTDQPCVLCGGTRTTFALLRGEWMLALMTNPLVAISLLAGGLALAVRLLSGWTVSVTGLSRRTAWAMGLVLVLANWVWVWMTLPR